MLFSCLPSRFAQENASVACHESARLPRLPLPLLLAQEKYLPNAFIYIPNAFSKTYSLFLEGNLGLLCFSTISMTVERIKDLSWRFVKVLFVLFCFLTVSKKNKKRLWIWKDAAGLSSYGINKNLKDLYCGLWPHSLSLYQPFVVVFILCRTRIAFAIWYTQYTHSL